MSKAKRSGVCKLTQCFGPYVKSHIIPFALTRLSGTGEKFVETGIGLGIKRRSSSWYDDALVTREGEDILADIDSTAIRELRSNRLVWSGWGAEQFLQTDDIQYCEGKPFIRVINLARHALLRIFLLSLLWRAATSSRPEFDAILLSDSVVEDLRVRICKRDPGLQADYPIQLFQVITRGVQHNRAPLLEQKDIVDTSQSNTISVEYARFYFDGLVAHIHIPAGQIFPSDYLNTCLGYQDNSIVFAHEFEESRELANIKEMVATVHREKMTHDFALNATTQAIRREWPTNKG